MTTFSTYSLRSLRLLLSQIKSNSLTVVVHFKPSYISHSFTMTGVLIPFHFGRYRDLFICQRRPHLTHPPSGKQIQTSHICRTCCLVGVERNLVSEWNLKDIYLSFVTVCSLMPSSCWIAGLPDCLLDLRSFRHYSALGRAKGYLCQSHFNLIDYPWLQSIPLFWASQLYKIPFCCLEKLVYVEIHVKKNPK